MSEANAKLGEYDYIAVLDKSGSMNEPVKAGSKVSRWEAMQESVTGFCRDLERIDSDGIGVVLFSGSSINTFDGVTADKVKEVLSLRPSGSTPLAQALTEAFKLAGKSDKKDFIVVFTDGTPDDRTAAANVIRAHANKQETDDACTVLFVQVGDDAAATAYLKSLDDDLKGAKFDIVDAITFEEFEKFASVTAIIEKAIAD